jgi:hypothetical protein
MLFEAWQLIEPSRMGIQWYHGLGEGVDVFTGVIIVVIKKIQVYRCTSYRLLRNDLRCLTPLL